MKWLCLSLAFLLIDPAWQSVIVDKSASTSVIRDIFPTVRQCITKSEVLECLKDEAIKTLDSAIQSDQEFKVNKFLSIKKNPNFHISENSDAGRSAKQDTNKLLTRKMVDLVKSRTFSFGFGSGPSDDDDEEEEDEEGNFPLKFGAITEKFRNFSLKFGPNKD
jgi:hypothetical protein